MFIAEMYYLVHKVYVYEHYYFFFLKGANKAEGGAPQAKETQG